MYNSGIRQLIMATTMLGGMQAGWASMVTDAEEESSYILPGKVVMNSSTQNELAGQPAFEVWSRQNSNTDRARDSSASWQQVMFHYADEHTYSQAISELKAHLRHEEDQVHAYFHDGRDHLDTHTYVPLPSVIWLFGSGLILLVGAALRRGTGIPQNDLSGSYF